MPQRHQHQKHWLKLLFACLVFLLCPIFRAAAIDDALLSKTERDAQALQLRLQQIGRDLFTPNRSEQSLSETRADIEQIRVDALTLSSELERPLAELSVQARQLGPLPVAGQTEAPTAAAQRADLNKLQSRFTALQAQLNLITGDAEQTSARVAGLLQDRFLQQVFEPGHSIFDPSLWLNGLQASTVMVQRLWGLAGKWLSEVTNRSGSSAVLLFLAICAGSAAALLFAQRWVRRMLDRRYAGQIVNELDRFWRVVRIGLGWLIFMAAFAVVSSAAAASLGVVTPRAERLFWAIFSLIFNIAVQTGMLRALLSPGEPAWRLAPLDDALARAISKLGIAAIVITAARDFIDNITELVFLPLTMTVFRGAVSAIVLCIILTLALRRFSPRTYSPAASGGHTYFAWMRFTRLPILIGIAVAGVSLVLGYVALADFVTFQLIQTLLLAILFYVVYRLADAFFDISLRPEAGPGRFLTENMFMTQRGLDRLRIGLCTVTDVALVVFGVPALLIQWTLTWIDLRSWVRSAIYGIEIGGLSISFSNILSTILVFATGLFLANLFTRWLDNRVLSQSRLDKGVRDSIRTAAGYAGIALATIAALTAAGLAFSNLALIAGALGVGIGFGLQSIVNNFVSGLILLAERPIKVGDWIQLATGEGLVKRINVRSTEIETFDNCTIIVPNSNLISEAVRNWTHRDAAGRFTISVTTEYGSNPEDIVALLKSLANEHRAVMSNPPAQAFFAGFGAIGMNFELKAHVADIFEAGFVSSELRVAIDRAFKQKGIRIPVAVQPPPKPKSRNKA